MFVWQLPDGRYRVRLSIGSGKERRQLTGTADTRDDIPLVERKLYEKACHIPAKKQNGWVYFVLNNRDHVKIGFTTNYAQRIRSYSDAARYAGGAVKLLALIAAKASDERVVHERWAEYRVFTPDGHRTEMFRFEGELKEYVDGLLLTSLV